MRRLRARKIGFTLVELLIVVGIIAILAAIAVPNFLEAQMRSKVSRVKTDMRSMSVALETYRADSNAYPPENYIHPLDKFLGDIICTPNILKVVRLTTPVAYMTSIPTDPFANREDIANSIRPFVYHYASRNDRLNNDGWWWSEDGRASKEWLLQSNGPDLNPVPFEFPEYDPANGTVSAGNILRMGP